MNFEARRIDVARKCFKVLCSLSAGNDGCSDETKYRAGAGERNDNN